MYKEMAEKANKNLENIKTEMKLSVKMTSKAVEECEKFK